jgi:hypothetical protein
MPELPPAPPPLPGLPFLAPPPPSGPKQRRWLPVFAVIGVIVALEVGGLVAAASVIEPAGPVEVAPGVTVTPADGWTVSGTQDDPPGVRLTAGSASLDVYVPDAPGATAEDLIERYVDDVLDPDASQLEVGEPTVVELPSGAKILSVGYVGVFDDVGPQIEGEVYAVPTSDGRGVIFDGWAPEGGLAPARDAIVMMIDGTTIP